MIPRTAPRLCLASIAAAVLALGAAGCCRNIPDEMFDNMFSAEIDGATLTEVREGNDDDDARCKAACMEIDASIAGSPESIVACSAEGIGEYIDAPWDPANDKVLLSCTGHYVEPGFCTGRRPLGHREAALAVDGRGAWLALHAHLEGASVIAFDELAAWLAARGAPAALRERCRAAADDEVRHAALLGALARREGAEVPPLAADPHDDDLVAVALHNAVEGCVAEAFAALIAARQAERADDPELRAAFASVAADELRHGQLAWDLHTWLWGQLDSSGREAVADAQARALAELPERIAAAAAATPPGLGWPTPAAAAAMARDFAARIDAALRLGHAA